MSKVVSPYPPMRDPDDSFKSPSMACWWRLLLRPNEDGYVYVMQTNAEGDDISTATMVSWEFFDGDNTVIDTGFDRPTKARIHSRGWNEYLDVLSEGPPTRSPGWQSITFPGEFQHPDDPKEW